MRFCSTTEPSVASSVCSSGAAAAHLDSFGLLADLHLEIEAGLLIQLEHDAATHLGLESRGRAGDFVLADSSSGKM